jgi:hypothetical protein
MMLEHCDILLDLVFVLKTEDNLAVLLLLPLVKVANNLYLFLSMVATALEVMADDNFLRIRRPSLMLLQVKLVGVNVEDNLYLLTVVEMSH